MTDPLSRGKIEDVILSIRRLVSESDAEQPRPEADRLLLTPSLRIGESAGGVAEGGGARNGTAQDIEAALAALEAEVTEKAGQWNGVAAEPGERAEQEESGAEAGTGPGEAEVPGRSEPEASRRSDEAGAELPPDDGAEPSPPAQEHLPEAEGPDAAYDAWEPAEAEPLRGAPADEGEVIELQAAEVDASRSARGGQTEPDMGAADIDSLLDERELRALVAEVLREELKGPLGERITRNVRKLVRREIAQALSSLNLD